VEGKEDGAVPLPGAELRMQTAIRDSQSAIRN
jgi:hypothetical protein